MSKSLRTFTLLSRSFINPRPLGHIRPHTRLWHSLTNQNGLVQIQPVRIKKPSIVTRIWRFSFEASCVILVARAVIWYFDLLEVDEEEIKASKAAAGSKSGSQINGVKGLKSIEKDGYGEEEGDEEVQIPEEMPEDAIFIPLGLTRQRPQTFYKGSDPEWQSFVEFRKDRDKERAVRKELALLVGNHFSGMKSMQRGLGSPMRVKQFWIDVIIPEGPPPEYERSGLEISDDYIAWTTRPVSALQRARFQSAILPLPVAKSFWASFHTSLSLQLAKVKHFLKLDSDSGNPSSSLPSGMPNLDQIQESGAKQDAQAPTRMDKISDPKSAEANSAKGISTASASDKILSSLPSIPKVGDDNGAAMTAFKRTLAKNWKPPHDFGERGTLLVTGLVQLDGPKGTCVLDIAASYHPRDSRYTHVACGIRNFRPRQQRPRGGF